MPLSFDTILAIVGVVLSCAPLVGIAVRVVSARRRPRSLADPNGMCVCP